MFLGVVEQVVILGVLVGLGALLAHTKLLSEQAVRGMTDVVLYIVTPCVIIKSFMRPFDRQTLNMLLMSFAAATAIHLLCIIAAWLIFRHSEQNRRAVLRFATVFSNCGFMALPLLESLIGADGVLMGAAFIAIFNLFTWTYGILIMSGDRRTMSPKGIVLNPGIIGIVVGLAVFILSLPLPDIIAKPIEYMAALNTPVPMLIIGYHIYHSNLISVIRDRECIVASALRLAVLPLVVLGGMWALGIRGNMLIALTISTSAPTAANTTMLAMKFGRDTELSVGMVALTTLLSLITMPFIITLAKYLS